MLKILLYMLFISSLMYLSFAQFPNITLRICALHDPPNLFVDNSTGTPQYSGFYYDLIDLVFSTAGYTPNYNYYVVPDNNFGAKVNGTWNGAVGELLTNKSDLFMGLLNPTYDRYATGIQFSRPVQQGGFAVLIRAPKKQVKPFSIFSPFTIQLWGLILCTVIAMSLIFYLFDRISPYGFYYQDDKEVRRESTYREMIHNSFMGILQKDNVYGGSMSFRVLQGFLFFFSIILLSTYTANLTTYLISSQPTPVISTFSDLKKKGIPFTTVSNSAAASYFNLPENVAYKTTLVYSSSTDEAIQMVVDKKTNVVLDYYANQKPCKMMIIGESDLLVKAFYGIPFSNHTDPAIVYNVSLAILTVIQNGKLDDLLTKWKNSLTFDCSSSISVSQKFDIVDLQGLFYVLVIGIGLAFIGVTFERIFLKYIYKEKNGFLRTIHKFFGGDSHLNVKRFSSKPEIKTSN